MLATLCLLTFKCIIGLVTKTLNLERKFKCSGTKILLHISY